MPNYYGGDKDWEAYAQSRPEYPKALFHKIRDYIGLSEQPSNTALDYGTGAGTIVGDLLHICRMSKVIGTDLNQHQLNVGVSDLRQKGIGEDKFCTICAPAGGLGQISTGSIDLITAAEAVHWFDQPKWLRECARLLRPNGGAVAAWYYTYWCQILDRPECVGPLHAIWVILSLKSQEGYVNQTPPASLMDTARTLVGNVRPADRYFTDHVNIQYLLPESVLKERPNQDEPESVFRRAVNTPSTSLHSASETEIHQAANADEVFLKRDGWTVAHLLRYIESLHFMDVDAWVGSPEGSKVMGDFERSLGDKKTFSVGWHIGMIMARRNGTPFEQA